MERESERHWANEDKKQERATLILMFVVSLPSAYFMGVRNYLSMLVFVVCGGIILKYLMGGK
jgi:hypothetical protein